MFEKTLGDLVRGIRSHKSNEHQYVSQCMTEIKKELKGDNLSAKANAISKLTYLQMMGYDISWAAFNMIEVMSSTKFTYKRIGYLAATQSFHEGLDVVMLTTNMIRKDISSPGQYDSSLALNGLACFMTPDLARDLANDVLALMSSSRPYLRKKAILVMYKIFLKFPDALRPAFPRLKDRLDDPDTGVQSASVSVICELARRNPRNYLSLAPIFFKLMTNSSNNWMLIKIIKLFGALTPLEPRLGKKLVEPLTNLIHSTTAMSLLYECICTVIVGLPGHSPSMQLCVSKLRLFIEDADQNLKYLGLLAMAKILQHQPKLLTQHRDLIVECLDDRDDSIRLRALDLISGMVSKKSLMDIVKKLMSHMDSSESTSYRDEVLAKIILMCSQNSYQHITNFEWYITMLVEMTKFEGTRHGKMIASQMLDVTIRVKDVRPFAVRQMSTILENTHLFTGSTTKEGICEVLYAAAWIVGEFSAHLSDARSTLDSLLNPKITALPAHIQAVFIQNIVKLYASLLVQAEAEGSTEVAEEVGAMLVEKLPVFMQSGDLEVQERACCILQLMKYIVKLQGKGAAVAEELVALFAGDLNPVAPKAQKKVPVPEGLDLDKWIYEPPSDSEDEFKSSDLTFMLGGSDDLNGPSSLRTTKKSKKRKGKKGGEEEEEDEDDEELEKRREQRRQDQLSNPHYLKPSISPKLPSRATEGTGLTTTSNYDVSSIPVAKLELGTALIIDEPKSLKGKKRKKRGKKGRHGDSDEDRVSRPLVKVGEGEMPEGALSSEPEDDKVKKSKQPLDQVDAALNQNLDMPLRDDEILPVRQHRVVTSGPVDEDSKESKSKKKKKKKRRSGKDEEEDDEDEEAKPRKSKKKRSSKKAELDVVDGDHHNLSPGPPIVSDGSEEIDSGVPVKGDPHSGSPSPPVTVRAPPATVRGGVDDIEFWLSADTTTTTSATGVAKSPSPATADASAKKAAAAAEPAAVSKRKGKGGKGKKSSSDDVAAAVAVVSEVVDEPAVAEEAEEEEERPKKSKKGEKRSKKERKSGKKSKSKAAVVAVEEEEVVKEKEESLGGGAELLDLDMSTKPAQPVSTFKPLAEDDNLKMTYEVRANPLYQGQVTVAVIFQNKTPDQIISLDFNVLDSLNTKLERPVGASSHDVVKVPFQLPPDMANECQFIFYVQSFLVPQKLRGTTTYMVKSESGTTGEKVDFRIHLPCSVFICPVPCAQDRFSSLLSGGSLCETQSAKVKLANVRDFADALTLVSGSLHMVVVEKIEDSASLYGCSIAQHHVCLLVKAQGGGVLSVNVKGSESQLVSNILDEIKALV